MTDSNAHFRSVLRGYDTAQVDQHVHELTQAAAAARREAGERTIEVSKLEAARAQLQGEVERHVHQARALEEAQTKAAAPTYAGLGERIGSILTLADKEADELRRSAQADAANHHALADESALATRAAADDYATETRSAADVEVARTLEDAKRHADSILDDADREATARREEAEAVYERARAKSAAAAADFETTLATRRDKASEEFAVQVSAAEQQLAAVQQRSEQTRADFEQAQREAAAKSAQQLEAARTQALTLVSEAKTKAERIRDDSERMLAAATQRRDSINAQLTNVRQMLTTLSGGPMVSSSELESSEPTDSGHAESGQAGSAPAEPDAEQRDSTAEAEPEDISVDVQTGEDTSPSVDEHTDEELADSEPSTDELPADELDDEQAGGQTSRSRQKAGAKR